MVSQDARLEEARERALIISRHLRQRRDERIRAMIEGFNEPLDFEGQLEDLAIAREAWDHMIQIGTTPKLVFAHPDLLQALPEASLHYRGIATLSLKRMQLMVGAVKKWEDGTLLRAPAAGRCLSVARVYNAVISAIITGTDDWTLENGYRNILATIGITEDGALRNIVGQEGEAAVKERISEWLAANDAIKIEVQGTTTFLGESKQHRMIYGTEPDIKFEQLNSQGVWDIVSTMEIKSGTDPAAALERLGAIQKSFEQTPARSRNFAVLGIVTKAMRKRLDELNVARDFLMYEILNDPAAWEDFTTEIFHHTLRVV